MKAKSKYLGIDVGSVTISIVLVNRNKKIIQTGYDFHEGRIASKLVEMLSLFKLKYIYGIAVTSSTPSIVKKSAAYDNRVAVITAARELHEKVGSILMIGGEKFGLIHFDENEQYRKFKSNSSCAAGTGSFLDQQCARLNIKGISEFSELACNNKGDFPKIAARCSVFAKTDLIHAQQEGYTLSEICDGLCYGLARNIVDTLFKTNRFNLPLVFAGGVSRNKAVVKHIGNLIETQPEIGEYSHLYGAIGAAMIFIDENPESNRFKIDSVDELIQENKQKMDYFFKPLQLEHSDYPHFTSFSSFEFKPKVLQNAPTVEVDIYTELRETKYDLYAGFDIGSTSTKAILIDKNKNVIAGFYTRTSGQPVIAVRSILETVEFVSNKYKTEFTFIGVGTTGSGRKFIGKIIGADIIPDEITAHARAAVELDKRVDTIIEIGGQDAKFTTLSNGSVTFSVMNNVCAAGTGSFIEEQANKLGVSLKDYSKRAEKTVAPMASDRCTVFMERDLNHYINENYKTNEILASVLHSVCQNYLTKVAVEKNIGKRIFFQGATAKNKALVAAFEQRLNKAILVSKYCHLTGAYGVALELHDNKFEKTAFRGIDLYKSDIPVRTEICDLCTNHCKYKIAEFEGIKEVYGFLCGRDYDSGKFVDNNISGFNLVKEYKKHFAFRPLNSLESGPIVGIPSGLYLFEDLLMWQRFFDLLKIRTITSLNFRDVVKTGKRISGAEFCAPMSAIQGHVMHLLGKADYIFLPTYLEDKQKTKYIRRQYCYYSQYAPPVIHSIDVFDQKNVIINPVLFSLQNDLLLINELFNSLKNAGLKGFTMVDVSMAFYKSKAEQNERLKQWKGKFIDLSENQEIFKVVLLGRPYTVLSETMNNSIPDIFATKGIKTFYQNMLDVNEDDIDTIREMLDTTKWKYAASILAGADKVARTKDLYPVFITSFKCSPDSFIIEYFKQLMDYYKKPYLVLQLDEYDSNVGYETRIEAALRSFENHFKGKSEKVTITAKNLSGNLLTDSKELKGKVLLMPALGEHASKLIEANLRRIGIEAYTLFDTEESIKKSLVSNTGQCLPLNIILQNAFEFIENNNIDPANTVLWMLESPISCNLGMFISYMSKTISERNPKFEDMKVYTGNISFVDISVNTTINSYLAFLFGGYLRKIECKIRPYEIHKGDTDAVIKKSMDLLYRTFLEGTSKENALKQVVEWVKQIEIRNENRPKVAIFGDLYARDNDVFNQNLVRFIEKNGGEAITTPYSEYVKIMFFASNARLFNEGFVFKASTRRFLIQLVTSLDAKYLKYFNEILHEPVMKPLKSYRDTLELFNLKTAYNGESLDNVLKIMHLKETYPEIALFVQTNPSYCCPSLVTEAMTSKIEKISGVPIVTIEYDGTSASKNENIIPFLKYAKY